MRDKLRIWSNGEVVDTIFNELKIMGFSVFRGPLLSGGISREFVDVALQNDDESAELLAGLICSYAGSGGYILAGDTGTTPEATFGGSEHHKMRSAFGDFREYQIFT